MTQKNYSQMMAYLIRPAMARGGRMFLNKGTMPIKQALEEIVKEKGTNFTSQKELTKLVADKVGYNPNIKILRPSKYPILKNITYESTSRAFTDKELKDILGDDLRKFKAQGLTDRQIRDRASSRKQFQNLSDEAKAAKRERNKINLAKRISQMSPDELEAMREQDALRMQEQRGTKPKYHRVSNAKSLLWNDLIRAAEAKDGYLSFKNFTPEPGKRYNKAETEKIVLVDRQGNEFKFNSLKEDITKHSGFKSEDVFRPYAQREFLNKQGLTQELNRFYGIKPGSRQSVFNIQHVQGISKNPFNVQLTFADQNISEAGAKRTFDADFKVADTLSKKKAAVKKFYANLGADIPTQLGKKEVGARRSLPELLEKTKFPIASDVMEKVNQLDLQIIESFGSESKQRLAAIGCPGKAMGSRIGFFEGQNLNACAAKGIQRLQTTDVKKLTPGDKANIKSITKTVQGGRLLKNVLGPGALALEGLFAAPFAAYDYARGRPGEDVFKSALSLGLLDQKLTTDELKKIFPEYGAADNLKNIGDRLTNLERLQKGTRGQRIRSRGKTKIAEDQFKKAVQPFLDTGDPEKAYLENIRKSEEAKKELQRQYDIRKQDRTMQFDLSDPFMAAGGGIAKEAGDSSGRPPESGPNSQGLPGLLKRVRNL